MNTGFRTYPSENVRAENDNLTSPNPSKGGEEDTEMNLQNDVDPEEFENDRPGYVTADLLNYKYLKEIREVLRENYTEAEKLLWEYLRSKKTGYRIRRQHVIDNFITDFVCLSAKVVIEIDGKIHLQQKEYDELRTNTLNEKGYKVIRFTNEEVLSNPGYVVIQIKETLDTRK